MPEGDDKKYAKVGMWLALGTGMGTAIGAATGNISMWLAIGAGIGVAIGAAMSGLGSGSDEE